MQQVGAVGSEGSTDLNNDETAEEEQEIGEWMTACRIRLWGMELTDGP
jgi:hypothetical protein